MQQKYIEVSTLQV